MTVEEIKAVAEIREELRVANVEAIRIRHKIQARLMDITRTCDHRHPDGTSAIDEDDRCCDICYGEEED